MAASERRLVVATAALAPAFVLAACFGGGGITPIRTPFDVGVYHHSRGELEPAIVRYRDALDIDPSDTRARFNLAVAYEDLAADERRRGRDGSRYVAAAEAEYVRVLELAPDHLRATLNLAALEADAGRAEAARVRLALGTARHGGDAQWHFARAALAMRDVDAGRGSEARGDAARATAAEAVAAALAIDPHHLGAWLTKGELARRAGDGAAALTAFRRANELAPEDIAALRALGIAEAEFGDRSAAVFAYERLLLLAPDDVDTHVALAALHETNGDPESAVRHLWRARDLDDGDPTVVDYAARLRALYVRLLDGGK